MGVIARAMRRGTAWSATTLALAMVGCAPPEPLDPVEWLADPAGRARALPGVAHLASSRQPEDPDGTGNGDFDHFVATVEGESVLLDASGPGVITRIWLTMQADGDRTVSNARRIHFYVDGLEIELGDAARGVTMGELTSGTLAAFPEPFVAAPTAASGAHLVMVPIAFQTSMRVTVDAMAVQTYYQIDWRSFAPETPVRAFSGTWSADQLEELERAADLLGGRLTWDGFRDEDVAPGGELRLEGARIVHRIRVSMPDGSELGADSRIELVVDGAPVYAGHPARWAGGTGLALEFASSGLGIDPAGVELSVPVPVAAELVVRNASPTALAIELEYEDRADAGELRALRVLCDRAGPSTDLRLLSPEVRGTAGHFAGVAGLVDGVAAGWQMMEGDHEIQVDGQWSILGTGAEDFFGGAYYFQDGPFSLPTSGAPAFDLGGATHLSAPDVDVALYRNLFLDRVDFSDSFVFSLENYVSGTTFDACIFVYVDR